MGHEKIANNSGQYEISFGEIPDRKLEPQPELKDIDWGNYSEENLKAKQEEEKKLAEVREEIKEIEENKDDDDKISDASFEYKRYDQFVEEPKSRPMTEEEKKKESLKAGAIESWQRRKEEGQKKKEWDDYWAK